MAAPHWGQCRGASSRCRSASPAKVAVGGGSGCGSSGSTPASGTGPDLGRLGVEAQQVLELGGVAGEAEVHPLEGEVGPGAELVLLTWQVDAVVRGRVADHGDRVAAGGHRGQLLLELLAEHGDAEVGLAQVLDRPVGDRALGDPGHDVLALDVVDDVVALLVAPGQLVVGDAVLVRGRGAVGGVDRVEYEPGGSVVDRDPDLHLPDAGAPGPHAVG